MNRLSLGFVAALAVTGCGPKEFGSLCTQTPAPAACMTPCDPAPGAATVCPGGFHCAPDGFCDAQCTPNSAECGDGYVCTADGRCVDDGQVGSNGPDMSCPAVTFTPMPKTPSIMLVLDQSGSMYDNNIAPNTTRYQGMRDALVGTTGVVTQLETKAYFGSMLYTCANNAPDFVTTNRALNNASTVRTSIDSRLTTRGGNTPTPQALNAAVQDFQQNPPPADSPPAIVLATDGLPNNCAGTANTESQSVQAATNAYAAGIPVYVLAINQNSTHFQNLANAGQGWQQGDPNVPYYPVSNAAQLQAAFQTIINGVISCDLSLTSSIDENQAMNGTLTINGVQQQYGSDWILVGGNTIRVQGAACNTLKTTQNPNVQATFPCGSIIF